MNSQTTNIDGDTCAVAILLYGDSLDTKDASILLELSPTRTRNRGEERTTSSGAQIVQKIGFWEHRVRVPLDNLSRTIVQMISAIQCETVLGRVGIEKAELDIFVPLSTKAQKNGFEMELSPQLMRRLAILGFDVLVTTRIAE
ncbi:DUF4279 domain-containing protein [Stenotrophomonas sp. SrG]|uniref:DUF4279 domain-containing protein n=1 Tax=Stenotrophomonas sp. SrG TaxID=3414430 RepID=UPI003CFA0626